MGTWVVWTIQKHLNWLRCMQTLVGHWNHLLDVVPSPARGGVSPIDKHYNVCWMMVMEEQCKNRWNNQDVVWVADFCVIEEPYCTHNCTSTTLLATDAVKCRVYFALWKFCPSVMKTFYSKFFHHLLILLLLQMNFILKINERLTNIIFAASLDWTW